MKFWWFRIALALLPMGTAFSAHGFVPPSEADAIVRDVDAAFRSSTRYIPGMDLFEHSFKAESPAKLKRLNSLSRDELLAALNRLKGPLQINQGVAENLIKLHQMTHLCANFQSIVATDAEQTCERVTTDTVSGLNQDALDKMVLSFAKTTPARADEWDYDLYELAQMAVRNATDNDWYKFKMAAVIFKHGLHKSKRVVYNMFSRGSDKRAFYVVGGTSLAIDAIKYFRFQEREIQFLKNHDQFANVPAEFFEYLRTWRFKGKIRAVRQGTVVAANETIMEIDTDPLSATLIECFLSPLIDSMTTSATKMARIVLAADHIPVVEGGTRRSGHGLYGAYGALIGMAAGTSNAKLSRLLKTLPYGSMEHAVFALFRHELEAHLAYGLMFPKSTHLIDENNIPEGMRLAIRAMGRNIGGARADSKMKDLSLGETIEWMRGFADSFDLPDLKILVSDRIKEATLAELKKGASSPQAVLVGTEVQNPSDVNGSNIVYKIVEVTDTATGLVRPIAKASEGKVGVPGRKEVFRIYAPVDPSSTEANLVQRAAGDVMAVKGEVIELGVPLLEDALDENGARLIPRRSILEDSQYTVGQIEAMPPEVLAIDAGRGAYPVRLSPLLKAKQEAVLRQKGAHEYRVGVQIGSFDPVTDAHVKIAVRTRDLYAMDRMVVVPANQDPIHGKVYTYSDQERLSMARRRYEPLGIEVSDIEVKAAAKPFTIDTLRALQKDASSEHAGAKIFVTVGYDVFADLIDNTGNSKWKRDQYALLNEGFSWVVNVRGDQSSLDIPPELLSADWERVVDSPRHYENRKTGAVIELVDLNVGTLVSSTRERELAAGVDTIFHGVDIQWTFWESINGRAPGTLTVGGSAKLLDNVIKLTQAVRQSTRAKSILTKDYHYEIERRDAKWNGEFHAPYNFPPHGMAERSGPAGHEILWEVQAVFPAEKKLTIPHNYEVKGVVPALDRLELKPFDLSQFAHEIVDPSVQIIIQKNGKNSYDFGQNPRSKEIVDRIGPKRVIVYGVATDFCVVSAAMTYLEWGYEVWLVTDAIAGVFPDKTVAELKTMEDAGIRFVTTEEVLKEYAPELIDTPAEACDQMLAGGASPAGAESAEKSAK